MTEINGYGYLREQIGEMRGQLNTLVKNVEAMEARIIAILKEDRLRHHEALNRATAVITANEATVHRLQNRVTRVENWQSTRDTEIRVSKFWLVTIAGAIGSGVTVAGTTFAKIMGWH